MKKNEYFKAEQMESSQNYEQERPPLTPMLPVESEEINQE